MLKKTVEKFRAPENHPYLKFVLELIEDSDNDFFITRSGKEVCICQLEDIPVPEMAEEPPEPPEFDDGPDFVN